MLACRANSLILDSRIPHHSLITEKRLAENLRCKASRAFQQAHHQSAAGFVTLFRTVASTKQTSLLQTLPLLPRTLSQRRGLTHRVINNTASEVPTVPVAILRPGSSRRRSSHGKTSIHIETKTRRRPITKTIMPLKSALTSTILSKKS